MSQAVRVLPLALALLLSACAGRTAAPADAPLSDAPLSGLSAAAVEPTRVVVHVVTHDAKLIGSAVGGVRVTVREAGSGRLLDEGLHEGGTGDTQAIMLEPRRRGVPVFETAGAARWVASLPLEAPTIVEVTAEGPLEHPDQLARASKRLLLVPGQHLGGDGIVLELHGFVIDVLAPGDGAMTGGAARDGAVTSGVAPADAPIPVRARVRMLCSCPTQPDGLWGAGEVTARLIRDGRQVAEVPLTYAGEASTYAGMLPPAGAGEYVLEVLASSPESATFGHVVRTLRLVGGGTPVP